MKMETWSAPHQSKRARRRPRRVVSVIFTQTGRGKREIPWREPERRLHVRKVERPDGRKQVIGTYGRFYNVYAVRETAIYSCALDELPGGYTKSEACAAARALGMRAVFIEQAH